jgi:hypothetical protein
MQNKITFLVASISKRGISKCISWLNSSFGGDGHGFSKRGNQDISSGTNIASSFANIFPSSPVVYGSYHYCRDSFPSSLPRHLARACSSFSGHMKDLHAVSTWCPLEIFPCNSRQTVQLWRGGVVGIWKGYSTLSEAPTFFCGFCGYKTTRSGHMVYHVRTHTGEKPFVCPFCERGFAENSSLKKHLNCKHREEKWS